MSSQIRYEIGSGFGKQIDEAAKKLQAERDATCHVFDREELRAYCEANGLPFCENPKQRPADKPRRVGHWPPVSRRKEAAKKAKQKK